MQDIEDYSDRRQKAWCVHCGAAIASVTTSRDHVPTKSLLDRPLPAHVPQVDICASCNNGFSLDEQYLVAFLSCVLAGSADPDRQSDDAIGRALARNPGLRMRIEASCEVRERGDGRQRHIWRPEQARIDRVVVKNARGHAFFEFGEPMLDEPVEIWSAPLESLSGAARAEFESVGGALWPEVGSRMMTRVLTGQDLVDGWVVVQDGVYRYAVSQDGGMIVKSVIRNYLATVVRWED